MNKKILYGVVTVGLVVASGFGGYVFGKKVSPRQFAPGNFSGVAGGQVRTFSGDGQRGAGSMNGDIVFGEVIQREDQSITIKLRDGGTKIAILSNTTAIGKSTIGVAADLKPGVSVTIAGDSNSDGSINARDIQIRSTMVTTTPSVN